MKLKTYLRGLGLGLIVAALVTGVGSRQTMSDEQIKARAKELGMMESKTYLTQVNESKEAAESLMESETVTETVAETEEIETTTLETAAETKENVTETKETVSEETAETVPETESEPVEESPQQSIEETTSPETVTFQIHSGDSSVSVAKRLAEAGLVGDAKAFDQYLCQNGYDKKIRVGTYEIQNDSSNEEIAKIITTGK
mgnify:FL=1